MIFLELPETTKNAILSTKLYYCYSDTQYLYRPSNSYYTVQWTSNLQGCQVERGLLKSVRLKGSRRKPRSGDI